eukprot:TRINITY_DN1091_c0_g2_i1.p1 TRINITY_DN1091_c0_g2~~TRINITY_DN1091_c0_g2_i1.p1  ORF type:complete len:658 (+),score=234.12 TRINITY_DN1091_c0_g2_i1:204-2177(+)
MKSLLRNGRSFEIYLTSRLVPSETRLLRSSTQPFIEARWRSTENKENTEPGQAKPLPEDPAAVFLRPWVTWHERQLAQLVENRRQAAPGRAPLSWSPQLGPEFQAEQEVLERTASMAEFSRRLREERSAERQQGFQLRQQRRLDAKLKKEEAREAREAAREARKAAREAAREAARAAPAADREAAAAAEAAAYAAFVARYTSSTNSTSSSNSSSDNTHNSSHKQQQQQKAAATTPSTPSAQQQQQPQQQGDSNSNSSSSDGAAAAAWWTSAVDERNVVNWLRMRNEQLRADNRAVAEIQRQAIGSLSGRLIDPPLRWWRSLAAAHRAAASSSLPPSVTHPAPDQHDVPAAAAAADVAANAAVPLSAAGSSATAAAAPSTTAAPSPDAAAAAVDVDAAADATGQQPQDSTPASTTATTTAAAEQLGVPGRGTALILRPMGPTQRFRRLVTEVLSWPRAFLRRRRSPVADSDKAAAASDKPSESAEQPAAEAGEAQEPPKRSSKEEKAMALKAIMERDPTFNLDRLLRMLRAYTLPRVVGALLDAELPVLRALCTDQAYQQLRTVISQRQAAQLRVESRLVCVRHCSLHEAKMVDEDTEPVLLVMCSVQQVNCVRDADGNIVDGGPDNIKLMHYLAGMRQAEDGWLVSQLQIVGGSSFL